MNTTPEVFLEAVRRGWLPENVEGVPDWIYAKITRDSKAKARAKAKSSPTATAVAFHKAKVA